jgi:hypothetical protein
MICEPIRALSGIHAYHQARSVLHLDKTHAPMGITRGVSPRARSRDRGESGSAAPGSAKLHVCYSPRKQGSGRRSEELA